MQNTCGLCSPTRHVCIARGNDFRLCDDHFLHVMERCPRFPIALPSASLLSDTLKYVSSHIADDSVCVSIFISNTVIMPCLSSLFAVFSEMFHISITPSFWYNCPGKRIRFSTHCPSLFNTLTLFISSAINFSCAVMVIRFFAE
jgi:hypothetical protein